MMVDSLRDNDCEFGVQVFDELQRGQKLFALYRAGRALLRPDEPAPELTAYLDGAVASIYRHALGMLALEIEEPGVTIDPSWRRQVLDAARQCGEFDELPDENSRDQEDWELLMACLETMVVGDTDFEAQDRLDADPDMTRKMDELMGVPANYYTEVPYDPPDGQINLYLDALMGLTPQGRGEGGGET
jgi:hypothetical protein